MNASVLNVNASYFYWNYNSNPLEQDVFEVRRILLVCFSVIVMFTNLMVVIAFITAYNLRDRIANYFILNLSINDFTTGFANAIYFSLSSRPFFDRSIFCAIISGMQPTLYVSSFVSMSLVSLDRYIYITSPLHYHLRMTAIRVKAAIILSWVIPIIIVIIIPNIVNLFYDVIEDHCSYVQSTSVTFTGPITAIVTVLIMLFTSVRILIEARKQRRKITNQVMTAAIPSTIIAKPAVEIRRLVNTVVLVLVFLVMWMPYVVVAATSMFTSQKIAGLTLELVGSFIFLNSCINPVLYAMNRDFKKAYLNIFCLKFV
ncbi:trace amine-associated receptor 365-like [Saccoglossus kowalevskii]|uniref:Dopamine receptor 2-like n=1 Tax=Saccoglossus kowalevskii TaxID=10224 RepID=A0ABM0MCG0_SACKO|nr:PREDICTED: dopamine receptor 2-like [Saccoglossus kowalevskii]